MPGYVFSIIMPAFNAEGTLRKAVESALLQSLGTELYEIILIDDCSEDSTLHIMEELASRSDNIRILKNTENMGQGFSRNRGVETARGEYITFLDADDLLRSDALESYLHEIQDDNPEIVYANVKKIHSHGITLHTLIREDLDNFKNKIISGEWVQSVWGATYQKYFLTTHKIQCTEGHFYEDIEFTVCCGLAASKVKTIDKVLYYWTVSNNSTTTSISHKKIQDAVYAQEKTCLILEEAGIFAEYRTEWEQRSIQFMRIIAGRIISFSEQREKQLTAFHEAIKNSKVFAKHNLTEHILAECQAEVDNPQTNKPERATLAEAAAGAVVLIGNVDYHIRQLVAISRQLTAMGIKNVLFDISNTKNFSSPRGISREEMASYADISYFAFELNEFLPLFLNARAYVLTADWDFIRPLLFQLKEHGIPTIGFYEGINDDFLVEPPIGIEKDLPYRHTDYLLLPGEYYKSIYARQKTEVAGLPSIRAMLQENVAFPQTPLAVINVNFSYKVLEHCRKQFLDTAIEACEKAGISYVISQHPADMSGLSAYSVSSNTVYEDIRRCSIFISRFSTCIMEAMAMGKPTIYHNPHGEKFPKFQDDPMGAFQITTSVDTLFASIKNALSDIQSGVDIRQRASTWLQLHTHTFAEHPPELYASQAIQRIVESDAENFRKRIELFAGLHTACAVIETMNEATQAALLRYPWLPPLYKKLTWGQKILVLLVLDRPRLKAELLRRHPKGLINLLANLL